jgi:hypothetical protein
MISAIYNEAPSATILFGGLITSGAMYTVEVLAQENTNHELSKLVLVVAGTMFAFMFPTYGWDKA